MNMQLTEPALEIAAPNARLALRRVFMDCAGHADSLPRRQVHLRLGAGRAKLAIESLWNRTMLRMSFVVVCGFLLGSCGLTETGTTAASGGAAQAQQAEQGRKSQQGIKRQIEDENQQAMDRQNAAADAAAR